MLADEARKTLADLDDAQQSKNNDDQQERAEDAAATITPVAGVGKDREGTKQQQDENNDKNE